MPIQSLLFDLGGVLLNLDTTRTRSAFIQLGMTNFDDLFGIGHADGFFKQYEVGKINDTAFVAEAKKLTHPGTTDTAILNAWNAMLLDFPKERVQLLESLKSKYRLFLFSNTNAIHLQALQQNFRKVYGKNLDDLFEKAYYSHLINLRKPDVKAFEFVVNDAGLNAATTLFIDDALVNVEGARAAGLQAIHLKPGMSVLDLKF